MKLIPFSAGLLCLSIAASAPDPRPAPPRAPVLAPLHPAVLAGRLERAPAQGGYTDLHEPLSAQEARALAGYVVPKREPVASPLSSTVYVPAVEPAPR